METGTFLQARPGRTRRRAAKAELGELANAVYRAIYEMTPRQRRAAARALRRLTARNCDWTLYELRAPLLSMIDAASSSRERQARARALSRESFT